MLTTSLTRADASMSTFTTPRIYTCLTDATGRQRRQAIVRTQFGEAQFKCQAGKIPEGMIFVPYGPPTCKLMGGDTDGTGMPTSKGWEVEVVPV